MGLTGRPRFLFRSETHPCTLGREIGVRHRSSIGLPNPPTRGIFQDRPRTQESTASRPRPHVHVQIAALSCAGWRATVATQCTFGIRLLPACAAAAAWDPVRRIIRIASFERCYAPSNQCRRVNGWELLHAACRDRVEPFSRLRCPPRPRPDPFSAHSAMIMNAMPRISLVTCVCGAVKHAPGFRFRNSVRRCLPGGGHEAVPRTTPAVSMDRRIERVP